jgi:hypothetical protein
MESTLEEFQTIPERHSSVPDSCDLLWKRGNQLSCCTYNSGAPGVCLRIVFTYFFEPEDNFCLKESLCFNLLSESNLREISFKEKKELGMRYVLVIPATWEACR